MIRRKKQLSTFFSVVFFSREVWYMLLSKVGLQQVTPGLQGKVFQNWRKLAEVQVPPIQRKGFNTLVSLVAWMLWKHRNTCVFDKAPPSIARIIQEVRDEASLWCLAGAAGLRGLWPYSCYVMWYRSSIVLYLR